MEMTKRAVAGYAAAAKRTASPEAGGEMIVPDMYPDVERIIDVSGLCCVKEKSLRKDALVLSGVCCLSILYKPEADEALRHLSLTLPWTHTEEGDFPEGSTAQTNVRLTFADARAVNPRKLQGLCGIVAENTIYAPETFEIGAEPTEACEILTETAAHHTILGMGETNFTVEETVELGVSRPEINEIIRLDPKLTLTETKVLGGKVVFKGNCVLRLGYFSESELCTAAPEFPFSGMAEIPGFEGDPDADIEIVLTATGIEAAEDSTERRRLSVSLHIEAQVLVSENRLLEAVVDLYQPGANLILQKETVRLCRREVPVVCRQHVRELLEVGADLASVEDARIGLTAVSRDTEGNPQVAAVISALFRRDDGSYDTVRRRFWVTATDTPIGNVSALLGEDLSAVATAGGIEVRFAVDFTFQAADSVPFETVVGVALSEEEQEKGHSVVLRQSVPGERLWDIAKQYGTTRDDLCAANKLEGETIAQPQVLLIPRKK